MKKIVAMMLCIVMMAMPTSSYAVMSEEPDAFKFDEYDMVTTMSEYEMAKKASEEFKKVRSGGVDPLDEYEVAFLNLCELPEETLLSCGYSDDEVDIMKAYADGTVSLEAAASRAAAVLTSGLRCTKHTSSMYTCVFSWEWDKISAGNETASYALAMAGINDQSMGIECSVVTKNATLYYYNTDGTYYGYEQPEAVVDASSITYEFDEFKPNNEHTYIWPKKGNATLCIEPAASGGSFACVRAKTAYFPSNFGPVSVGVSVMWGFISITGTTDIGEEVGNIANNHVIYYNDGSNAVQQT